MKKNISGFTLLEILLSIAIIAVIFGIGAPIYQSLQNKNGLDVAVNIFVQSARRAQLLSQASDGDSTWGVRFDSNNVIVFKGVNYAGRDANYDEIFSVDSVLATTGTVEYVFSKLSGQPVATGTLILTSLNNETKSITINSQGMVAY